MVYKCPICSNPLDNKRIQRKRKYCSRSCYSKDRRTNVDRNPNFKDGSCVTNYGSQVAYRKRGRMKRNVRDALARAVKNGTVKRLPCEQCGNEKSEAHHTDYAEPLDVIWLCKKCHAKEHYQK